MSLVVKRKRPDGTVEEMDAEKLWQERDAAEQDAARLARALWEVEDANDEKHSELRAALAAHEARVKGGAP